MKLVEVIDNWISGDWGDEFSNGDNTNAVYCIRSADIVPIYNNLFYKATKRFVSTKSLKKNKLSLDNIIIEKSGGTKNCSTGRPIYVTEEILKNNSPLLCSNFCTAFKVKKEFDSRYVYYLLRYYHKRGVFMNYEGKTSGIHNLDIELAYNAIVFPKIDLSTQKRISTVVSTIEKKISVNRSINRNLEAMVKKLYDYWFVQFDFPDENGKPYKSSGGEMVYNEILKREIPEGWEAKKIDDVADVLNGATPATTDDDNYGGDIVWITPKDLSNQQAKFVYKGERNISQKGYDSCSTHIIPPKSILMSSRAPIGLLAIAETKLCTNQGFKNFVPKNENISTYLYYYLSMHIKQIERLGSGTTFKEVSRDDIINYNIIKPCDSILLKWEKIVSTINGLQIKIQKENESLTNLLNRILPLLMNGQVKVKNM